MPTTKKPIKRSPVRKVARHKVRDGIEKMILEGRIRPGEKLVQLQLARMFDVSLGMIREALFELQRTGLIETIDNRGIFVRRMDPEAIREFYVVRELFEGLAARECCGKLKPKDASELRKMAREICRLAIANQQREKVALDRAFHSRIVELSGNRVLFAMSQQYRVLGKILGFNTDPQTVLEGHLAIVDAIEKNDPATAERIAREHVRGIVELAQQKVAEQHAEVVWLT